MSNLKEIIEGLRGESKAIPSKYFYDDRGSKLFEKITDLDVYYPTRTELSILNKHLNSIVTAVGKKVVLIELGSGSSKKTKLLLSNLHELAAYVPVDISEKYLFSTVEKLQEDYPQLIIKPVAADYTTEFQLPDISAPFSRQVVFYPGSTIGNFTPSEAKAFLQNLNKLLDDKAAVLVGVDLKKDKSVLEDAYNDEQGITEAFNKNMLIRLNREYGADFEINSFTHRAFYNTAEGRIEMHLVSSKKQQVHLGDCEITFEKGESIHTENSYKYTLREFEELVRDWFEVKQVWTDKRNYFSLQFLTKK